MQLDRRRRRMRWRRSNHEAVDARFGRSVGAGRKTSGGMPRKNAQGEIVWARSRGARHAAADTAADRDIASRLNG